MLVFWEYRHPPPPPHPMITRTIDSYQIPSENKAKYAKNSNLITLLATVHMTHLMELLEWMCKYEMDLASIVEDTVRTRFCPQMDGHQYTT